MLRALDRNIWVADGPPVSFMTVPYPTRMLAVRLRGGELWVCSPIGLSEALRREVAALGEPAHIVSPNKLHHLYLGEWAEAWPGARLWAPPGLKRRRRDLDFNDQLGDIAPGDWADDIDQTVVGGSIAMAEVVFFHRSSATLFIADLVQKFDPATLGPFQRFIMAADGMLGPKGSTPREWRASFLRRSAARAAVRRAIGWQPRRLILAHGPIIEEDVPEVLRASFAWLRV